MVREVVTARLFGAGAANDAFQLAFRIPSLTRNLFTEGALSSAFVPVITRSHATEGKREAADLSNLVATAVFLVMAPLSMLGMVSRSAVGRGSGPSSRPLQETCYLASSMLRK